jgi:hypothetical protein
MLVVEVVESVVESVVVIGGGGGGGTHRYVIVSLQATPVPRPLPVVAVPCCT